MSLVAVRLRPTVGVAIVAVGVDAVSRFVVDQMIPDSPHWRRAAALQLVEHEQPMRMLSRA